MSSESMGGSGGKPIDPDVLLSTVVELDRISPLEVAKQLKVSYGAADRALGDLVKVHYLEVLPESGIVTTYHVTKEGYAAAEALRSRRGLFGLFGSGSRDG